LTHAAVRGSQVVQRTGRVCIERSFCSAPDAKRSLIAIPGIFKIALFLQHLSQIIQGDGQFGMLAVLGTVDGSQCSFQVSSCLTVAAHFPQEHAQVVEGDHVLRMLRCVCFFQYGQRSLVVLPGLFQLAILLEEGAQIV
jgi:hypothetical protein